MARLQQPVSHRHDAVNIHVNILHSRVWREGKRCLNGGLRVNYALNTG